MFYLSFLAFFVNYCISISSVRVVIRLNDAEFDLWQGQRFFLFFRMSRLALRPTQSLIQ